MPAYASGRNRTKESIPVHEFTLSDINRLLEIPTLPVQDEARLATLIGNYIKSKDKCGDKIDNLGNFYYLLSQKQPESTVLPQISNALAGQIRYLSKKETHLTATQKIEVVLGMNPIAAQEPKVLEACRKTLSEQSAHVKKMEKLQEQKWLNISIAQTFARDYNIFSPLGQSWTRWASEDIRYYPKDIYHEGKLLSATNYLRKEHRDKADSERWGESDEKLRGASVSLKEEEIPDNIGRCAVDYYTSVANGANKMLKVEKDQDIREYLWNKIANAKRFATESKEMIAEGAEKKEFVHHLITSREELELSDSKIAREKYWSSLYNIAGSSELKKGIIWFKRHGGTVCLWMAYAGSIVEPPLGAAMFTLMGSGQAMLGIQRGDLQQTLFGLSMIGGFNKNPFVRNLSVAYLNSAIGMNLIELGHSVGVTGVGSSDIENLTNNLILLHGWFRARAQKIGMENRLELTPDRVTKARVEEKSKRRRVRKKQKPKVEYLRGNSYEAPEVARTFNISQKTLENSVEEWTGKDITQFEFVYEGGADRVFALFEKGGNTIPEGHIKLSNKVRIGNRFVEPIMERWDLQSSVEVKYSTEICSIKHIDGINLDKALYGVVMNENGVQVELNETQLSYIYGKYVRNAYTLGIGDGHGENYRVSMNEGKLQLTRLDFGRTLSELTRKDILKIFSGEYMNSKSGSPDATIKNLLNKHENIEMFFRGFREQARIENRGIDAPRKVFETAKKQSNNSYNKRGVLHPQEIWKIDGQIKNMETRAKMTWEKSWGEILRIRNSITNKEHQNDLPQNLFNYPIGD